MAKKPDSKADENPPGKGSWRGKGAGGGGAAAAGSKSKQYRWQQDWTKKQDEGRVRGNRWHRVKIGFFALASIALTGYFFYVIFYRAPMTPFITASVTDYAWPLPPNAWAWEDLAAYKVLDQQTLDWKDDTVHWSSAQLGLKHLAESLEDFKLKRITRPSIIIYLTAHGIVNGAGEPCLLMPTADSHLLDESTWLPLSKVLDVVQAAELPDDLHKVLILDANRIDTNWGAGIMENGFAKSLEPSLRNRAPKDRIPRLTILNSASPGQIGWYSTDMKKSIFGHYVYLGLKGEADFDQNNRVSLTELHQYVDAQVNQWVSENRADQQRPMLVNVDEEELLDFELTFKPTKAWGFGWLWGTDVPPEEIPESESLKLASAGLNDVWKGHDVALAQDPRRFAPMEWREFEHKLLQLELMARGGSAYELLTISGVADLKQRVADMKFGRLTATLPTHSVSLAEHFGRAPKATADTYAGKIRLGIESFVKNPSKAALDKTAAGLVSVDDVFAPAGAIEGQQLRMFSRFLDDRVWEKDAALVAQVVAVRELAERLAGDSHMPGSKNRRSDERVQYWIRTTINAGDRFLRQAEDNLLIGDSDSLVATKVAADKAKAAYERAAAFGNSVARALKLRDQVSAELPYLAQWLTRRVVAGQKTQEKEADARIKNNLQALIEESHNFGNYLEESLPTNTLETEPTADEMNEARLAIDKRVENLSTQFDSIQNDFQKACEDLVTKAGQDQRTLRELDYALSIPLVKAKDRVKMRATYADLSRRLHEQYVAGHQNLDFEIQDETANPPELTDPYLERMAGWGTHPALGLIESIAPLEKQRAARKMTFDRKQTWMREILGGLSGELRSVTRKLEEIENPDNELEIRRIYNRADRLARSSAALTSLMPAHEPADQLRRVDLRHLLSWHARRALEDFWGPPSERKPSFFADVARSYLEAAKTVWQTEAGVKKQFEPEINLLEARRNAAKVGVQADTPAIVLTGEESEVSHATTPRVDPGVPKGRAAIYLMDTEKKAPLAVTFGDRGLVRRMGVNVPVAGTPEPLRYTIAANEVTSEFYQAYGMFRGHLYPHPFSVTHGGGVLIVREAPVPTPPRITLKGQYTVQGSVVVILDCSNSMSAKTRDEGGETTTRMEVAKTAFERLMDGFSAAGDYQVGAYFYGHRAGWQSDPNQPREVLLQKRFLNPPRENLQPYEDVEQIVKLGRFGPQQKAKVLAALETVRPWGETPLYLSIREALNEFNLASGEAQSIIAITDGMNNVLQPTRDKLVNKDLLLDALKKRPIPVHIVSFELSAAERATAGGEFNEISTKSGGSYFEAKSAAELSNYLQKALGPKMFAVTGAGKTFEGKIHGTVEVTPPPTERTRYTVELKTRDGVFEAPVELEGGEGLELVISPKDRALIHKRYDDRAPVFSPEVSDPAASGSYLVGLHRPLFKPTSAQGDRVPHFLISLQNANEKRFSPRPVETWVEIVPKYPGGSAPDDPNLPEKFTFCDLNFEMFTPVPVLVLPVPNWPKEAKRAEVTVFWKYKRSTTPDTEVTVESALSMSEGDRQINHAPKTRYEVSTRGGQAQGTQRVAVILKGPDVDTIKVTMDPEPKTAYHRVDLRNGIAVHNFDFAGAREPDVLKYKLQFTTKQSLKTDSLEIKEPLSVEVVDLGGVFK